MKRSVVVVFLAALLAVASPAHAASTVLTDPAGDATICHTLPFHPNPVCQPVDPYLVSDPTVDIVSFEIGSSPTADVVLEIEVVDLDDWWTSDHYKRTGYSVRATTHAGVVELGLDAVRVGDATVGYLNLGGTNSFGSWKLTPVTFDTSSNTIRWELSYDRLNEALDEACPSCVDFGVGTTATGLRVTTTHIYENRVAMNADEIYAWTASYVMGD